MLWLKTRKESEAEPDSRVHLRTLAGLTGHLLVAEGPNEEKMRSLPCTVQRINRTYIAVTLLRQEAVPLQVQSAVILEVVTQRALLQCFTSVTSLGKDGSVLLNRPARPHVVQRRRFPRVDLFLSVSVGTPDRPIERLPAQMINLSLEGAACVMVEPLAPGTIVTLDLAAMGLHPPLAKATVVRCRPSPSHLWVTGLQFHPLIPEQELYLGKYIGDFADQQHET